MVFEGIGEIRHEYTGKVIPGDEADFFLNFDRGCKVHDDADFTWIEDTEEVEIDGKIYTVTVFTNWNRYDNHLNIFIS